MATKDLRITLVQASLQWEDVKGNLQMFSNQFNKLNRNETDLIILPEMFSTGFSMNAASLAERMDGISMQWMAETAAKLNAAICGSLIITEKKKYFNRFVWMNADGTYDYYDKRHLFRMGKENGIYTVGKKRLIINYKGWNICPMVCYDLRFPVWSRNGLNAQNDAPLYDLLLYVANWPSVRSYAWRQLLIARAIENQCYVAGVNRVDNDGNGMEHTGDSAVLNPKGEYLLKLNPGKKQLATAILSFKELEGFRKIFPVMLDADKYRFLMS